MIHSEDNKKILLEEWKVCVEMANNVSQRRDKLNNLFITLNVTLITMISISWNIKSLIIDGAGIVATILWLLLIRNYRILNTEKFNIINKIEQSFPAKPFNDEWDALRNESKYIDSTKLEYILTILFIIIYIVLAIIIILNH